jgi:hypothetical protein
MPQVEICVKHVSQQIRGRFNIAKVTFINYLTELEIQVARKALKNPYNTNHKNTEDRQII